MVQEIFDRLEGQAQSEPERLFLARRSDIPDLVDTVSERITQVYLSNKGRVRAYEASDGQVRYDAAIKTDDPKNPGSKREAEDTISAEDFTRCLDIETSRLIKTRYYFYEDEDVKIFIDVIEKGEFQGLALVEIEGKKGQESVDNFKALDWLGSEVTGQLTNYQLATDTVRADILAQIKKHV